MSKKQAPLALPVCPYCGNTYSYQEVKASRKTPDIKCTACKKDFKMTFETPLCVLILVNVLIGAAINIALYFLFTNAMLVLMAGMLVVVGIAIVATVVLIPFVTRYVKPEDMTYSTRKTRHR